MLSHAVAERFHHQSGVRLSQVGPAGVVVRGEDQDLVDAAGRRLRVYGAEMADHHRIVTAEGGIEVGDHPHLPPPIRTVALQCRGHLALPARAEGAGPLRVILDRQATRKEVRGPLGPLPGDHYPPARHRVEPELAHRRAGGK